MRTTIKKAVLSLGLAVLGTIFAAGTASAAGSTDVGAGDPASSLSSAARSVKTTFINKTDCTYYNYDAWLWHGIWSIYPPTIPPNSTVVFGSESSGLFTGTEGYVRYMPQDGCWYDPPAFELHWNNPYVGSNTYKSELNGYGYKLTRTGGSGNNASVVYTLAHGY